MCSGGKELFTLYAKSIVEIAASGGRGRRENKLRWLTLCGIVILTVARRVTNYIIQKCVCGRYRHYNNHGRAAFEDAIVLVPEPCART